MGETPSEAHNRIARETFMAMGREVMARNGDDVELMIVLESVILGGLWLARRAYNVDRRITVERLEAMTERLCERLGANP